MDGRPGRDFGAALVALPTAADLVADDLRRLIAAGLLEDDAELDAGTTLMARYGISRPTLREALRVLAAEHLLELTAGTRKARVRAPSIDVAAQHLSLLLASRGATLADLRAARDLIDLAAVRTLAEQAPETRRARLAELAQQALPFATEPDPTAEPTCLHETFVAVCGNRTLTLAADLTASILRQQELRVGSPERPADPRTGGDAPADLQALLSSLDAGDVDRADRAFRDHLARCGTPYDEELAGAAVVDLARRASVDGPSVAGASGEAAAIADELRASIVDGKLTPGTRLPTDLHTSCGVSRVTMRSAIRLLESEGLLKVIRGARGGVEVTRPTAHQAARYLILLLGPRGVDIHDYAVARRATQPLVVESMVDSIDDDGIRRLRAAAAREERMRRAGDIPGFARGAVGFQGLVAELSGSVALEVLTEVLDRMVVGPYLEMLLDPDYDGPRSSLMDAHRHLIELAEQRNGTAARRQWAALTGELAAAFLNHRAVRGRREERH